MENEENKVSLEKNDNEMNNKTNVSSYQNEKYGQRIIHGTMQDTRM